MNITNLAAGFSGTGWLPLADAILKATLLFAIAAIASLALRRGSAAARHLMWTLALVSALGPAGAFARAAALAAASRHGRVYVHEPGRSGQRSAACARVHRARTRTTAPAHGRERPR